MKGIFLVFIVLFLSSFASAYEKSYKDFFEEKIEQQGKVFKEKLRPCINRIIGHETKLPNVWRSYTFREYIEKYEEIYKECGDIIEKYGKIYWDAFDDYYSYKLNNAKTTDVKIESFGVKIDKYRFVFLKIFIDYELYHITDVFVDSEKKIPTPKCSSKDHVLMYFQSPEKTFNLTIYYTYHKALERFFKKFREYEERRKPPEDIKLPDFYKATAKISLDDFREIKAKIKKLNDGYLIKLPVPLKAYVSYDFVGIKKFFPRENGCYKPEIKVKELPDSLHILMTVVEGIVVKEKDFTVNLY